MPTTLRAGFTAAAGTSLALSLFLMFFTHKKRSPMGDHSDWPDLTFVNCPVFAPAALHRAWPVVSVAISGLPLSWPLPIFAMVVHYTTIKHNRPQTHPRACKTFNKWLFQDHLSIRDYDQFPGNIPYLRVGCLRVKEQFAKRTSRFNLHDLVPIR